MRKTHLEYARSSQRQYLIKGQSFLGLDRGHKTYLIHAFAQLYRSASDSDNLEQKFIQDVPFSSPD